MADQATMRAVLTEAGQTVPARGRLSGEMISLYEEISGDVPDGPDYDGGVTEADFAPGEIIEPDRPGDPPAADPSAVAGAGGAGGPGADTSAPGRERRPRRVRQTKPKLRERLKTVQGRPGKPAAKAKRKHPRVPVDRLIGRGYQMAGRVFMQISPPIGRCIQWQAPTAGVILEGVVRDTAADRVLQPLARAEEKGAAVAALAGPPILIGLLQAAQGLPDDQRAMREALIVPMLREALALNVRIAGEQMEAIAQREIEDGPIYERVDRLIGMMFAPPTPAPPNADDQAAAAAQHMAGV